MRTKKIMLGSMEFSLLSSLEHDKLSVFSFSDAYKRASTTRQVVRKVLSRLVKKGRIKRIKKGYYLLIPLRFKEWGEHEFSLVPFLAKEYYISFWSALSFWSLTEQMPRQVYVAVKFHVKDRPFEEVNYKFVKLSKRYFFGFVETEIQGRKINIASKEKAILDGLLHPEYCGGLGEIAKAIRDYHKDIDWKKMKDYLKKMDNSAVERRLYYVLKFLKIKNVLGNKIFLGVRLLDPNKSKNGRYDYSFGLQINTNLEEEML
ncbi:MAG: type IV toxin-antitoxin system AbiEi family antitoxin [Candidatus Micrarchaeota archaeon]